MIVRERDLREAQRQAPRAFHLHCFPWILSDILKEEQRHWEDEEEERNIQWELSARYAAAAGASLISE